MLVFALPQSPLAQPRNVIGGHLISAAAGLFVFSLLGPTPLAFALGVRLAISEPRLATAVPCASLRMFYPLARFQLELVGDFETRILTLETPDGFNVSFGLTQQCREIAEGHPCESLPKLPVD